MDSVEVSHRPVFAVAPIPSIHNVALVLAKLDETASPSYPEEGFLDRDGLTLAVIEVIDVMTTGAADWCPLMQDIVDRSLEFFLPGSPAQEAFMRDWGRCRLLADCT